MRVEKGIETNCWRDWGRTERGEMDDMGRLVLFEELPRLLLIPAQEINTSLTRSICWMLHTSGRPPKSQ